MNGSTGQKVNGSPVQLMRYARTPASVLHDLKLSVWARLVYTEIALHVWHGRVTRVGQRLIAKNLGFHQETVLRAVRELAERGLLDVVGAGKARRSYVLHSPVFAQKQGQETVVVSSPSGGRRMVSVGPEVKGA